MEPSQDDDRGGSQHPITSSPTENQMSGQPPNQTSPPQSSHLSPSVSDDENATNLNNLNISSISGSNSLEMDFDYTYTPMKTEKDQEYNEEDLRNLAESLAPRVTSLLHSNEAALENLLNSTRNLVELDSDGMEEDGIDEELDRLAGAERLLRDELEMSNGGFDFMGYGYGGGTGSDSGSYSGSGSESGGSVDKDVNHRKLEHEQVQLQDRDRVLNDDVEQKDKDPMEKSLSAHTDDHEGIYDSSSSNASYNSSRGRNDVDRGLVVDARLEHVDDTNPLSNTSSGVGSNIKGDARQGINMKSKNGMPLDVQVPIQRSTMAKIPSPLKPKTSEPTYKSPSSSPGKKAYTLYDHAKRIGLMFDNSDLGYPTCPLLSETEAGAILDVPSFRTDFNASSPYGSSSGLDASGEEDSAGGTSSNPPTDTVEEKTDDDERKKSIHEIVQCMREYVKPMSSSALSRIFMGLTDERNTYHKNTKLKRRENEKEGEENREESEDAGISITTSNGDPICGPNREILPVRTVAIQIRPDVLVGAVMDAVYTSINSLDGEVTKRQGGHLRALAPGKWVPESESLPFRTEREPTVVSKLFGSPMMQPMGDAMNGMVFHPALVIDAQLCTRKKSRFAERVLLVRCFSISGGQILDSGAAVCPATKGPPHAPVEIMRNSGHTDLSDMVVEKPSTLLRESASLFQRMRAVATLGGKIAFDLKDLMDNEDETNDPMQTPQNTQHESSYMRKILTSPLKLFSPSSQRNQNSKARTRRKQKAINVRFDSPQNALVGEDAAYDLASEKLLSSFTVTPSVLEEVHDIDPLAALSPADWPYLQSSSRFFTDCLNELDNRDLGYSTLTASSFGVFPALMSLDVHYCSQIRDICKEMMIASLLKSCQELEIYAREAEYGCAKLMQILEPTLFSYNEKLPELPEAIPLTSYPLNFTPHEVTSPPWGQKVIEALNQIAVKLSSHKNEDEELNEKVKQVSPISANNGSESEFSKAKDAVCKVLTAFQKQEDEELSARVGRKNCQVMDRLAKMQAYKRESVMTVRGSYGINPLATKAADRFHAYAKEYCKLEADEMHNTESQMKMTIISASDQVPLLSCRVMHGGSAGVCYLTYHELLLVTQSIPLVGGNYLNLVLLNEIKVEVRSKGKKSRLNPMPSILVVKKRNGGEELFSFRPSTGAHLFKDFVDIIQGIAGESPDAVNFSSTGGLKSMFDEKNLVAKAALGRDN